MAHRNLLITDFFPRCESPTASQLLSQEEDSTPKTSPSGNSLVRSNSSTSDVISTSVKVEDVSKPMKASVSNRMKFVRHQSAPLHHRSPVKSRGSPISDQDLNEIRAQIRTYRMELYKYKSNYSRSPIKRVASNSIDPLNSPFKHPTPVKSHPSIAAFERYSPLPKTVELPMPDKYQLLFEQYKHLDFLVCHNHNNGGISTFEKLQPIIQQKTKRNFTLTTLGRIKTVCPNMYTFQQEKIQLPTLSPMKLNYELTITPSNECSIQPEIQINPSMIVERIDSFRRSLFQIVKSHHRDFLAEKLHLSFDQLPEDEALVRWHADFDLNNVPDIESSPLPLAPDNSFKKVLASPVEIRQYAEKTSSQRVKRALFSTFSSDDVTATINLSSPKKENLTIDGISPALIDKIRLKETSQLLAFDLVDQERVMLSRLEQMINIIQQFFIAERAATLDFDLVARQIRDCHSAPLSYVEACETLQYLCEHSANNGWISIINIRDRKYVKLNRHQSINSIIEHIQQLLNRSS